MMRRSLSYKISILGVLLLLFAACCSPRDREPKKFDLTSEERIWLEKFLRYFMLHETAIYTLAGSKPLTEISLFYSEKPEKQLREEQREQFFYFLLNRDDEKDIAFYNKLSSNEKENKAILVHGEDFIYNIEELWDKWEKIQYRFPLKKKFLLVKKERAPEASWKEVFPEYRAIYDILFVDILKTALVIQENYEAFKQAVGYDFDAMEVVFELENEHSHFWNKINGEDAYRYAHLWGLLFGFGKENAFSYLWKGRHIKGLCRNEKEKSLAATLKPRRSCGKGPSCSDKGAFSIANFSIPVFTSFSQNDPVVTQYEAEREKMKRLYKGKDFVDFTLELLTEP